MMPIVRPDARAGLRRISSCRRGLALALLLPVLLAGCASHRHREHAGEIYSRQALLARFKQVDSNGDEQLTRDEMTRGMPELAAHFDDIDLDHNQLVNFAELWSYMQLRAFTAQDARDHGRYRGNSD
ncbi:MAG: hypothetical protein ACRETM_13040 [Stenotrophobium sp.]